MNKYILTIALLISALSSYSQDAQLVLIDKHNFKLYPPQLQKESPYNSIGLPSQINAVDTVITVSVKNKNGEYYRFGPRLCVFLKPGSKVIMDYDYRNSYLSKFSGDLVKENTFLNSVILKPIHEFDKNITLAKSYDEFCTNIKHYEEVLLSQCEAFKKEKQFYNDCKARIDFIVALAHCDFITQSKMSLKSKIQDESTMEAKIKDVENNILPLVKKEVLKRVSKYSEEKIISYRQGCALLGAMNNYGSFTRDHGYIKYSEIYDYSILKYDIAQMYSPDLLVFKSKIKDPVVLADINYFLKENQRLLRGSLFKDAEVTDVSGKKCKLSDFKGSVLYIDLWATWCNPCKALAPSFYAIADDMSEYKNIKFISISIDSKFDTWKKYVEKNPHTDNVSAFHISDDEFLKHNNITSIPRFILVDKDFKIVAAYASKPFENRITIIKELLKNISEE